MYTRQRKVNVSEEYLETLCSWMQEWGADKKNMIIAQFCSRYGIGFGYLKYFVCISPKLANIYETTLATLCERWLLYAMKTKDMPNHMHKVVMKYLRAYDHQSYYQDLEARKELAYEKTSTDPNFIKEDYSKEQLDGIYKQLYEQNVNKR